MKEKSSSFFERIMSNRRNVVIAVLASIQHVRGFHSLGYSCLSRNNANPTLNGVPIDDEDGELYPPMDVNSMARLYSTAYDTNNNAPPEHSSFLKRVQENPPLYAFGNEWFMLESCLSHKQENCIAPKEVQTDKHHELPFRKIVGALENGVPENIGNTHTQTKGCLRRD